jgi:hypothetical protein
MLEDIAPAVTSSPRVKMRSVAIPGNHPGLSFETSLSFLPFVNYLKQQAAGKDDTRSRMYQYLIGRFESEPSLLGSIENPDVLDEHRDLLELLGTYLFPVVSEADKNIFALTVPYHFTVFNDSDAFRNLFVRDDKFLLPDNAPVDFLTQAQCALLYDHVMEKFYGIRLNSNTDIVYPVTDPETGMKRYYKLRYDRRFIELKAKGDLPDIQNCAVCMNTFRILDQEKQLRTMPPSLFSVEGFGIWIAEDVTAHESLESMKKVLLRQENCDTGVIGELKSHIQQLVGLHEIEVGLSPFVKLNNEFVLDETCARHGLMAKYWKAGQPESMELFRMSLDFLRERPEPMPVAVVNEEMANLAPFLRRLWEDGARSYLIYPVQNHDGVLGLLELASPIPNHLTQETLSRLEPAMPLISFALLKNRETFSDKVEKLIKEKFTALQPSVEWKFAKVAWEYMHNPGDNGSGVATGNVVFDEVYPLYGAVDVRNSAGERSIAIQKDIKAQQELVEATLDKLESVMRLPLLEGLKFKNFSFRQAIEHNFAAEDEIRINDFFVNEVAPVFRHLQKGNTDAGVVVDHYFNLVDAMDSYLYRYRNEYEATLAAINDAVLAYLEKEEDVLQLSYPHYFEKYRTDGVEYSIYIGQSIAPNNPFDILYLKNIRLWQLKSMAEIARITHGLLPSLPVPLQTTQLLLIHSQPISIGFRRDERRFDVEGSYNIRYEVVKKRLDKVHIKDTGERLTQPGKIAMVYSNPKEAAEYQEYILFLQSKGVLGPVIESLELEELQGVSGLKALRVSVQP